MCGKEHHHCRRFIPACAGNAKKRKPPKNRTTVHPRMRGERPFYRPPVCRPLRFIPACAGNALMFFVAASSIAVHPRMRGERASDDGRIDDVAGSSPHARGTHWRFTWRYWRFRFIPACAGNAPENTGFPSFRAVHPRMRGERTNRGSVIIAPRGSSPHARGTPLVPSAWDSITAVHPRMRGERRNGKDRWRA